MNLKCSVHQDSQIFCLLREQNSVKFLCDECIVDVQIEKPNINLNQMINLKKALDEPSYLFYQLIGRKFQSLSLESFQQQAKNIKLKFFEIINQFQRQINKIQLEFQMYFRQIEDLISDMQNRICFQVYQKYINEYKTIQNLILNLHQEKQNIQSIENQLNSMFLKIYQQFQDNSISYSAEEFYWNNQDILAQKNFVEQKLVNNYVQQIEQVQFDFQNLVFNRFATELNPSKICRSFFWKKIFFEKFSNNKKQQIYHSVNDGLDFNVYSNKIQGRKNLLMIFKSANGQIFGGYSTCIWDLKRYGYIHESSGQSFIFNENRQLICPHKSDQAGQTIWCGQGYVAFFGYDLCVHQDFKTGYSYLGRQYKYDSLDGSKQDTTLFGALTPNVIECEVLQIL